jgi:integrase
MTKKTRHHNGGVRKICGCPRRSWPKCAHPWHFSFKWKDTHHRFSLDKHLDRQLDSKSDAEDAAATIRMAIKAGTFGQATPRADMTVRQFFDLYLERYVDVQRAARRQAFVYALDTIARTVVPRPIAGRAAIGDWRLTDVVTDTIERFREVRRAAGVGPTGVNRNLQSFRAALNWGVRTGYLPASPFKRGTETAVRLSKEARRSRRLQEGEEEKLLAAAGPHLRAIVEGALETGMRRGEIMSLTWGQIRGMTIEKDDRQKDRIVWAPRAEIFLPASKTKTKTDRRIPISTRLKTILEMRRCDPAGVPLALDTYVFGTEIGTKVDASKRAWATAVLKAHGHTPRFTPTTKNLTAESRAALRAIDLHFHDLRREAGSRWLDGAVPLHTVRDWLGHTSIAQTSTYLAGTLATQHDAMRQFDVRRGRLQPLATEVKTEGRKRPRTAISRPRTTNKTAVGLNPTIQ